MILKTLPVIFILILTIVFTACNEKSELLPNSTGKRGEVLLVAEESFWNSIPYFILKDLLTQDYPALPQDEEIFKIFPLKSSNISEAFKLSRNIIKITYNKNVATTVLYYKRNLWAKPQLYLEIISPNDDSLKFFLERKGPEIVDFFINEEINRLKFIYHKYKNKELTVPLNKFNINISFPKGYRLNVDTTNFLWISYETINTSQGFFIYSYPYRDTSLFNLKKLIAIKDSVLQKNVPGPTHGSYMTTEKLFTPIERRFFLNNTFIHEIRGLWKIENDFMGGPFVTYVVPIKDKVVFIDGYVYAPKYDKKNYVWEIEAILKTLTIKLANNCTTI
ncbi:MAG: DUF4837 family protein [Bacteroidales bacterium]|nr:DUF4837 family protein [Bacteroidales bacterium]